VKTPLFNINRREMLKKIIGVSVGTTVAQVLGVGQSLTAISALADSSTSKSINPVNIIPELAYEALIPIAKRLGEGIGEFSYSIGDAGATTVRGAGEAGADVFRGIGEGLKERLRDITSDAEGKRKLQEYALQQNFERKREIAQLMRDSLREYQAKQIKLKLTEIQSSWDLENWNGVLSRQETEDLLKEQTGSLLVLLSPPEISLDAPSSLRNNLQIELEDLEAFLVRYYPDRDKQHTVKFYSDYFKRPIGNINVEQLQKILTPVPTVIVDMDVTDYTYTVKVHFWGVKNNECQFYASNVWNWENETKDLISQGANEKEALRMIRKTIVNSNKFLLAYLADLYYLNLDPYYQIKFTKISTELVRSGLDGEWLKPYTNKLQEIQQKEQQVYEQELQVLVYDLEQETIRANAQKWKLSNTLFGHTKDIYSIACSPDGQTLTSGSYDRTVKIWNIKTGKITRTLDEYSFGVMSVAFSSDRQTIMSGSLDRNIKIWNFRTGQLIRSLDGNSTGVISVAFSPDGQTVANGSYDRTVKIWSVKTGELIRTLDGHLNEVTSVTFSTDGQTIASGSSDKTIKLWSVKTGELIRTLAGHLKEVMSVTFSPDGQTIASGSYDRTIKLWSVKTGELLRTLDRNSGAVFSVVFSPNGHTLASGSADRTIKLWSIKTGELLRTLDGHIGTVFSVVFSPDGHTLASGSSDTTINIWRDI
jgi:WD40 repeat protein